MVFMEAERQQETGNNMANGPAMLVSCLKMSLVNTTSAISTEYLNSRIRYLL